MADDFYKLYCEEVEKNEKLVKENKYLKGRFAASQASSII